MKRASGELGEPQSADSSALPPSAEATEEREAAVKRAKTFLEQPDAVLEPDAPRQIRKYVLGSATSAVSGEERRIVATKLAQTVIETLCKNFQHYPAMCEMLSKWIAKLQPAEDSMSIILKCFKKQIIATFNTASADHALLGGGGLPKWVDRMIQEPLWRETVYELSELHSSSFLSCIISLIDVAGHQSELRVVKGAASNFTVFGKNLVQRINAIITHVVNGQPPPLRDAEDEFCRVCLISEHSYVYAQSLLRGLQNRCHKNPTQIVLLRRMSHLLRRAANQQKDGSLRLELRLTDIRRLPEAYKIMLSLFPKDVGVSISAQKVSEVYALLSKAWSKEDRLDSSDDCPTPPSCGMLDSSDEELSGRSPINRARVAQFRGGKQSGAKGGKRQKGGQPKLSGRPQQGQIGKPSTASSATENDSVLGHRMGSHSFGNERVDDTEEEGMTGYGDGNDFDSDASGSDSGLDGGIGMRHRALDVEMDDEEEEEEEEVDDDLNDREQRELDALMKKEEVQIKKSRSFPVRPLQSLQKGGGKFGGKIARTHHVPTADELDEEDEDGDERNSRTMMDKMDIDGESHASSNASDEQESVDYHLEEEPLGEREDPDFLYPDEAEDGEERSASERSFSDLIAPGAPAPWDAEDGERVEQGSGVDQQSVTASSIPSRQRRKAGTVYDESIWDMRAVSSAG